MKYSLQSIILLFVYVVLVNLFVDKMVVAVVLMKWLAYNNSLPSYIF